MTPQHKRKLKMTQYLPLHLTEPMIETKASSAIAYVLISAAIVVISMGCLVLWLLRP